MTFDQFLTVDQDVLKSRTEARFVDQLSAQIRGQHFWIAGMIYRVNGPSDDVVLDAENLCGYTQVHCAICGAETNDNPTCPGLG